MQTSNESTVKTFELINHTVLNNAETTNEVKEAYLKCLGLFINPKDKINTNAEQFLKQLCKLAKLSPEINATFKSMTKVINTKDKFASCKTDLSLLSQEQSLIYTWLADAVYLTTLLNTDHHQSANSTMIKVINVLQLENLTARYDDIKTIVYTEKEKECLNAVYFINEYSDYWRNILTYRDFKFTGELNQIASQIAVCIVPVELFTKGYKLAYDSLGADYDEQLEECLYGDNIFRKSTSIFRKSAIKIHRKIILSEIKDYQSDCAKYLSDKTRLLNNANEHLKNFGFQTKPFNDNVSSLDIRLDTSANNANFCQQVDEMLKVIEHNFEDFEVAINNTHSQLVKVSSGIYFHQPR